MTVRKTASVLLSVCWSLSALAVVATVFVVAPELWNGTVSGKYFWFFAAQGAFAAMTWLGVLAGRGKGYAVCFLDLLVVLFVGYVAVNYLVRGQGFEIKLYLLLLLGAFYVCLRIWLQAMPVARRLLPVALVVAAGVEAFVGLMQLYGWERSHHALYRTTGHFFNPGPFSGYVALAVPLAVYAVLSLWPQAETRWKNIGAILCGGKADLPRRRSRWGQVAEKAKRILCGEGSGALLMVAVSGWALVAAMLVIPAAMSRSAWLAILAGVAVVVAWQYDVLGRAREYFRKNRKKGFVLLAVFVVLTGAAMAGVYNLKRGSAEGRLFLWKVAAEAMAQQPVFGVGLGNFAGAYGEAQYEYFRRGVDPQEAMAADSPAYAFNEYLQVGVEEGLVGGLLLLTLVGVAVRYCLRDRGKAGVLGAIVAMLVFSLTSYPLSVLPICISSVALLALAAPWETRWRVGRWRVGVLALGLLVGCGMVCREAQGWKRAYVSWRQLSFVGSYAYGDYGEDFEKLMPYFRRNDRFLFAYGKALAAREHYEASTEVLSEGAGRSSDPMFYNLMGNNYLALGQVEKAEECYRRAYYILPNRHYPLYLLTKLYNETGQVEKARAMARCLLDKKPKVMSTAIREMQEYAEKILAGGTVR